MKIDLIASDLDGTLLTDQKEITKETRAALKAAAAQGAYFVPATGRSLGAVPMEIQTIPEAEYIITSNGAAVYSLRDKEYIYRRTMTAESIDQILGLTLPENMTFEAMVDGNPYTEQRYLEDPAWFGATEFGVGYIRSTRHGVNDLRAFIKENRERIDSMSFVCRAEETRVQFWEGLRQNISQIRITSSVINLIEVSHENVCKGITLRWLMDYLKVDKEHAMAFGDADNDLEMLSDVTYGFAMGNGTKACKGAAYAVTDTNENNGVAKAIMEILESNRADAI